jgi:aspartyl-tRNA(Asn)/glutamyl-tRNA(Gln) amidotransferase subunit A
MVRFPDWSALTRPERERRPAQARQRAQALQGLLNAFVFIETRDQPPRDGILTGMACAAKDMFRIPGREPGGGLRTAGDLGIGGLSDAVARLGAAGATLVGHTQMTELAYEPSGLNASFGRVRNPWNTDYITGGSSSGSAAAVAAGIVDVALGSDTGGSLRIPASCCGVSAWKPTWGLVPADGAMPLAPTLDTVGLLARSADDLIAAASEIATLPPATRLHRIAAAEDLAARSEPDVQEVFAAVIAALRANGAGIEPKSIAPAIADADRHALVVLQGESARMHRARIDNPALAPMLRKRLAKGLEIDDATLAESVAARPALARDFERDALGECDALLLPVMPIATPEAAVCDPSSERFSARTLYALSAFTRFVNMLGFPAVAFPAGFDRRGLPVGVQIVGRPGSDLALLDLVRHVQTRTDWHGRVPSSVAPFISEAELRP